MKTTPFLLLFFLVGCFSFLTAGPEIYDPLEAYKKSNTLASRPQRETVTQGTTIETAKFKYDKGALVQTDYLDNKGHPTGYSKYDYENGVLVRERLFSAGGTLAEEITYEYKKDKLVKTLIHDVRGNARIEWHYAYNKEGKLVAGKRLLAKRTTESFRIAESPTGTTQYIYNARGEQTSRVDSTYEDGLLRHRVKSGLVGARYAEYRYNAAKELVEIIYHETVRGEKKLVKKHRFEYSLASNTPATAFKAGS